MSLIPTSSFSPYYFFKSTLRKGDYERGERREAISAVKTKIVFLLIIFSNTHSIMEIKEGEKGEKRKELNMSLIPTSSFSPYYFFLTNTPNGIKERGERREVKYISNA